MSACGGLSGWLDGALGSLLEPILFGQLGYFIQLFSMMVGSNTAIKLGEQVLGMCSKTLICVLYSCMLYQNTEL